MQIERLQEDVYKLSFSLKTAKVALTLHPSKLISESSGVAQQENEDENLGITEQIEETYQDRVVILRSKVVGVTKEYSLYDDGDWFSRVALLTENDSIGYSWLDEDDAKELADMLEVWATEKHRYSGLLNDKMKSQ